MNDIFVDTGAFLGAILQKDQHRTVALHAWEELNSLPFRLISTEHVLDEVATFLVRASLPSVASKWLKLQMSSSVVDWTITSKQDLIDAARWFEKFVDQRLSFTDAISFAIMKRRDIHRVFGFDHHFSLAGFELWPGQ